jgi:uncharacterized membrane protein (DUF4010 family)
MLTDLRALAIALAIGLLLGFEREHHRWSEHAEDIATGTRTFGIVAVSGAISASVSPLAIAAGIVATGILVGIGYSRGSPNRTGMTTEFTAILCFLLGALCWSDARLAVSVASIIALLLESKEWTRKLVRDIVTGAEVIDAARWFVLAFVILPLIPDRPIGPNGLVNPARVWELVVLLTAVGWFGYIATRAVGEKRGLLVVGATGGFVSGAATTASLARLSKQNASERTAALGGSILASASTCVQLVVLALLAAPSFGKLLLAPMIGGTVVLIATAAAIVRFGSKQNSRDPDTKQSLDRRPLALTASLVGAAVLTITIVASRYLVDRLGTSVALAASAASGLADAHSASLSAALLVRESAVTPSTGLGFVGAALAANTCTKLLAAFTGGGRWFAVRFAVALTPAVSLIAVLLFVAARSVD